VDTGLVDNAAGDTIERIDFADHSAFPYTAKRGIA
jgi:hypothetical protein